MCVTAVSLACITVSPPCLPPAGSVQLRPSAAHTGHAQLWLRALLPETQPADTRGPPRSPAAEQGLCAVEVGFSSGPPA